MSYIFNTTFTITGEPTQVEAVETLVNKVCELHGTPNNIMGLFTPISLFLQVLIGKNDYEGNILSMEKRAPNKLLIRFEYEPRAEIAIEDALKKYLNVSVKIRHVSTMRI